MYYVNQYSDKDWSKFSYWMLDQLALDAFDFALTQLFICLVTQEKWQIYIVAFRSI